MHFYEFITTQIQPNQDKDIDSFLAYIKNDKTFPKNNSDPTTLAIQLYLHLDEKQTTAFQKLLMLYKHMVKNHKLPKRTTAREDMFLTAINLIVSLQNNDSNYKFHTR